MCYEDKAAVNGLLVHGESVELCCLLLHLFRPISQVIYIRARTSSIRRSPEHDCSTPTLSLMRAPNCSSDVSNLPSYAVSSTCGLIAVLMGTPIFENMAAWFANSTSQMLHMREQLRNCIRICTCRSGYLQVQWKLSPAG